MKTLTIRLTERHEELVKEIMEDQFLKTGSSALIRALENFILYKSHTETLLEKVESLNKEIKDLQTTIKHLR